MSINLDSVGEFTWGFGSKFLIQVGSDYYTWSDPEYNGTNEIRPFNGSPQNFTSKGFCGRDKGIHRIRDYCGEMVTFVDCDEIGCKPKGL